MTPRQIKIGRAYQFPSGIVRRVIAIEQLSPTYGRARLENLTGRMPGHRMWENLEYMANNVTLNNNF